MRTAQRPVLPRMKHLRRARRWLIQSRAIHCHCPVLTFPLEGDFQQVFDGGTVRSVHSWSRKKFRFSKGREASVRYQRDAKTRGTSVTGTLGLPTTPAGGNQRQDHATVWSTSTSEKFLFFKNWRAAIVPPRRPRSRLRGHARKCRAVAPVSAGPAQVWQRVVQTTDHHPSKNVLRQRQSTFSIL